jgi:hypothetical protein
MANGQRQQWLRRRLAGRHSCCHYVRPDSGLFTDSSSPPHAGPTTGAGGTSKSSRYTSVYSSTAPESVISYQL